MGIVDPFNTKEQKSEYTYAARERTALDKMAEREKKDKETLAAK